MVNVFKHRKINKNPFVKFLKDFNKKDLETEKPLLIEEGNVKGCLNLNGRSIITLDNERAVFIKKDSLFLINKVYYPFGCFKIPIEELDYTSGNIYFITNTVDSSFKYDFQLFFSSKKELYELIAEFDSIRKGNKVKEIILAMHEAGLFKAKIKSLNLDVDLG